MRKPVSIVVAITMCLTLEAAPASGDTPGVSARIDIGFPSVGFVVIGGRQYYKRRPGWGYRRHRHGWYRIDPQPGGYIVIGGRHYYERSPGQGYRRNVHGWYKYKSGKKSKEWRGGGRGQKRGHGREQKRGRGHGRGNKR
jgi:hypothetical protein